MWRILLILLILFNSHLHAQELIPGSYRNQYGGVYKIAAEESSRWLENQWRDQEFSWYEEGKLSYGQFIRRHIAISDRLNDWRDGPPWWTRKWWDSFEEKNGGAPPNKSIVVRHGSDFKLIDTNLFSLSNSFAFKWKSFQASVDFKAKEPILFGVGNIPNPRYGWKFKFSPEFKFSTNAIFGQPSRIIRRIGIKFTATHWIRKPLFDIEVLAWYTPIKNRVFVGVNMVLLQW